jgi:hypothetical protein
MSTEIPRDVFWITVPDISPPKARLQIGLILSISIHRRREKSDERYPKALFICEDTFSMKI